jgi:hypothetical protein
VDAIGATDEIPHLAKYALAIVLTLENEVARLGNWAQSRGLWPCLPHPPISPRQAKKLLLPGATIQSINQTINERWC